MGIQLTMKNIMLLLSIIFMAMIGASVWDSVFGGTCQRRQLEDISYLKSLAWAANPGIKRTEILKIQPCVKWMEIDYYDSYNNRYCEYAIHFASTLRSETFCEEDTSIDFVKSVSKIKAGEEYVVIIEKNKINITKGG